MPKSAEEAHHVPANIARLIPEQSKQHAGFDVADLARLIPEQSKQHAGFDLSSFARLVNDLSRQHAEFDLATYARIVTDLSRPHADLDLSVLKLLAVEASRWLQNIDVSALQAQVDSVGRNPFESMAIDGVAVVEQAKLVIETVSQLQRIDLESLINELETELSSRKGRVREGIRQFFANFVYVVVWIGTLQFIFKVFDSPGQGAVDLTVILAMTGATGNAVALAAVDGMFIWTPSHDQRPRSFSTALLRGCDPCRLGAAVHVERPSEARTNDLDGRRALDSAGLAAIWSCLGTATTVTECG